MATETVTWASVGSAGSWVASSGTLLACVQTEANGTHGIEPTSTSSMFGIPADFTAGSGETVNSVTIRAVMRVATAGDSCEVSNMLRVGAGSNVTHATARLVNTTAFTEYEWVWATQPNGTAWTVAAANDIARCYIDPALSALGGALHLDVIQVTLDYGSASPTPATGSAAGTWAFTGAASGSRTPEATATGSWGFTGTAAGERTPKGSASGAYAFTGTATGQAPAVDQSSGTASGAWSFTGVAVGKRSPKGVAAGALAFVGAAVGARASLGTAAGTWGFVGAASGLSEAVGTLTVRDAAPVHTVAAVTASHSAAAVPPRHTVRSAP